MDKKIYWMSGRRGTGKSQFAEEYCAKKGISCVTLQGTDQELVGYNGQQALILMAINKDSWNLSDLRTLINNFKANTGKFAGNKTDTLFISAWDSFNRFAYNCDDFKWNGEEKLEKIEKEFTQELLFTFEYIAEGKKETETYYNTPAGRKEILSKMSA